MPYAFAHSELMASDVPATNSFFGKLLGCSFKDMKGAGGMGYTMLGLGETKKG